MTPVKKQARRVQPVRPIRVRRVVETLVPFHASIGLGSSGAPTQLSHWEITIPAGKRLIIESVTARATLPPGQHVMLSITSTTGGRAIMHFVALTAQGDFPPEDVYAATSAVRIYADAETPLRFEAWRSERMGTANVNVTVSGRYVPMV